MKTQRKAELYDELLKDYENLIDEINSHIESSNEISEYKCYNACTDGSNRQLWASVQHHGINFLLSLKAATATGMLKFYKSQF